MGEGEGDNGAGRGEGEGVEARGGAGVGRVQGGKGGEVAWGKGAFSPHGTSYEPK